MFGQTLAFLTRSIRQESRLLTHHAVRGFFLNSLKHRDAARLDCFSSGALQTAVTFV
jgi:hypothetical protein